MSELFDSVIGLSEAGVSDLDLDSVFGAGGGGVASASRKDLLSASLQDSGILRPNCNQEAEWLLDHDTDDLLKSMLTGNDIGTSGDSHNGPQVLLDDINGAGTMIDFDRQLLSPADSAVSSGSGSNTSSCYGTAVTSANPSIDLMDIFNDDLDDDKSLIQTCVNPHTNSPDTDPEDHQMTPTPPPPPPKDNVKKAKTQTSRRVKPAAALVPSPTPTQATRVVLKAHRASPAAPRTGQRVASTNVYHHNTKPVISVVRNGQATPATAANITLAPSTAAAAAAPFATTAVQAAANASQSFETGTTTIYLPVLNAKNVQQPTIIRMSPATAAAAAAATSVVTTTPLAAGLQGLPVASSLKRRRMSASSDDSVQSDEASDIFMGKPVGGKYPRLHLNDEERRLCEKEGVVLPSHYPLTKEEERNLKRIRRKIRNKQSAQDSRKRKKEHVENMEARAMKCAQENAELVKKLSQLEAQNKTLVGQLRRLHQIIVNKGGISSSNVVAQAAMHQNKGQGQTSTAMMVLLLSTALFLIPGMREQLETKPSLDIQQVVKSGPPMPIPGQSRSLLQFTGQSAHVKQEQEEQQQQFVAGASYQQGGGGEGMAAANNSNNKNRINLRGGGFHVGNDHDYTSGSSAARKRSYVVADAPTLGYGDNTSIKQEPAASTEQGDERRLNISVTGGQSGTTRTVVLTVPKGL